MNFIQDNKNKKLHPSYSGIAECRLTCYELIFLQCILSLKAPSHCSVDLEQHLYALVVICYLIVVSGLMDVGHLFI